MFELIKSWRFHKALKEARSYRKLFHTQLVQAEDRGDCREIGRIRTLYERATTDVLRLELGSR